MPDRTQATGFPQEINTSTDFTGYGASKWVRDYNATPQGQDAPSFRAPTPAGQQLDSVTGFTPGATADWDWQDPPQNAEGTPLDQNNKPLAVGALGFKPNGQTYWGENLTGAWNKISSAWKFNKEKDEIGTESYRQHQDLLARTENKSALTRTWKVDVMGGVAGAVLKTLGAVVMGGFEIAEEAVQRPVTTLQGAIFDKAEESNLPDIPTITDVAFNEEEGKFLKKATVGGLKLLESVSTLRFGYETMRALEATLSDKFLFLSGQQDVQTFTKNQSSFFRLLKTNWASSRMGWSLGVGDGQIKAEFLERVSDGENPDLVAMDLSNPAAQFIGEVFLDATGLIGAVSKSIKAGKEIIVLSDDLLKPAIEVVEFMASKGDGVAGVLKSADNVDELAEVTAKVMDRVEQARIVESKKQGFWNLQGKAKRIQATQEAAIFGSWIANNADSADDAIQAFQKLAGMASKNIDERAKALHWLQGFMKDPSALFSDEAAKFGLILRNVFLDADGVLDASKFADEFVKIQETGDKYEIFKFVGNQMDGAINKAFPLLSESVAAGDDVPLVMKAVNFLDNSAANKVKNAVSWFSGRAYIGTNPGVATRGGLYDLIISVIDTDASILTKSAPAWADVSKAWLGGMDHPALHKGIVGIGAEELGQTLAKDTGLSHNIVKDVLLAIRGEKGQGAVDAFSLPFARVLEALEKRSGAKLLGKSSDTFMKKMLRSDGALKNIDALVEAGLPPEAAGKLMNRIIGNYGDTEKVKKLLLEEVAAGRLNLFSDGAWIPNDIRKLLNEFGLENSFLSHLQEGKPLEEVVQWISKAQENLYAQTSELAKQHVQAVAENLKVGDATDEILAIANKELQELIDTGSGGDRLRKAQELLDESGDFWTADVETKEAWRNAAHHLKTQLDNMAKTDPELKQIMDGLGTVPFDSISRPFAKVAVEADNMNGLVVNLTKKLRQAKGSKVADLIEEAKGLLGVSYLPSDKKDAYDMIWDIWARDQKPASYAAGRQAVGDEFDKLLKILTNSGIPEEVVDNIVSTSAKVDRARVLNTLADQFHNGIMVKGELKPVGPYFAHLFSTGNFKDLNRVIAKYTAFTPLAKPGSKIYDSDILFDMGKQLDMKASDIADVNPEELFSAIQKWRVESGLSKQADELADLMKLSAAVDEAGEVVPLLARVIPESMIPAQLSDMDNMNEARHIFEMKQPLDDMFARLTELTGENFGKAMPVDPAKLSDVKLVKAIDDYFVDAGQKVSEARLVAMKAAEGVRDFALHDYSKRYGFDAALSYLFNFHFWPSRTAAKWIKSRAIANPQLISAYMDFRELMQDVHQDSPDWWKYAINTNELLGLDMDNPLYFRLENLVQPVYFMAGSDFTDETKRANWWSSLMDGVGKAMPGYWNPLVQYTVATALYAKEEKDAAAHWAGRALPATAIIKSITALIGVKGGQGLELDPGVKIFSGGTDPFEENRIATMLATYIKNGDYTEEEILEAALNHEGEAWERAIADQSQQYGWGNIASQFMGINTRLRTPEDLEVERFWGDYTRMWARSGEMTAEEITYNLEQLRVAYPFMEPLLLGRKGGVERSEAYVWNVLARVEPGKTDDLSTAIGLPYDLIGKFYDDRGDTSGWLPQERDLLFSMAIDIGASLELPASATRLDWAGASFDYREMLEDGKLIFGEEIWDKLDRAYVELDKGINGSVSFQRYVDANPDVDQAMQWKEGQIMNNPLLQSYYVSHKKLRDFYKGDMYQKLEDEFTSKIWDTWDEYYSLHNTGQKVEAKLFKAQHPEMKAYSDQKKIYEAEISEKMVEFGEDLPEGIPTRLQEGFVPETAIQESVEAFVNQPEQRAYRISEWVEIIGQGETALALQIYNGLLEMSDLPDDIRTGIENGAFGIGMSVEDMLRAIGTADR